MKRLLFVFMFLLPLSLLAQTTYYVSNSGSDSNSGMSESSPWRSLTKVNSYFFMAGDKILFKRGDSWEGTITVRTSGTAGNPITYGAYGSGNKPRIYGSEVITGWTRYSGNIYKATFNKKITQLFLNDKRMQLARYDNDGDFFDVTTVNSQTQLTSTDIESKPTNYYKGATIIARVNEWRLDAREVIGSSGQTFIFDSELTYTLSTSSGFFLTNKLEFLTEPGQWYCDLNTNTVYLWTPNGDSPSNYTIRGSTIVNGIFVNNKDYITIQDLDIMQYAGNGVYTKNSDYVSIENNGLYDHDLYGLNLSGSSYTVVNNTIERVNYNGIVFNGSNSTISDNKILDTSLFEDLGLEALNGTSISSTGNNNIIRYNRIINSAYHGINWNGKNCTLEYNYIENVCTYLQDGGAIYSWSSDVNNLIDYGSVVRYNIINKANGYGSIFMDSRVTDITIENNTIINSDAGIYGETAYTKAVFLQYTKNIIIKNNTMFNNQVGFKVRGDYGGVLMNNNIICNISTTRGYFPYEARLGQYDILNTAISLNNNVYVDRTRTKLFRDDGEGINYSFSGWQIATGEDSNSRLENSALQEGEEEELLYNDTKETKIFDLGSYVYKNIYGQEISDKLTLEPFTSIILVGADFNDIEEEDENESSIGVVGSDEVYDLITKNSNRRAVPVTVGSSGSISSISIYHEGGSGGLLLGVYSEDNGSPGSLLGVTSSTAIKATSGWQTVSLESPVPVSSGETVWLSWVFENNPGIRYTSGTLGRAESSEGWDSGMPSSFGIAGYANYQYSIYCTYMSGGVSELTAGSDEVYDLITKNSNRRAVPVTVGSSGSISSISIYHEGGSGGLLLGVYSEDNGSPGSLLGVTSSTAIKATSGWQTVSLESPVPVSSGETVWLSWVFENNPGIRYTSGTSGRAESSEGWDSGMPSSFGIAGYANYQYSIYCTYMSGGVSELTAGSDEVYDLITKNSNRRAVPVTVGSSGSISSISIYHEGGSGGLLLGVYSEDNGSPGSLLGVTSSTAIKATSGWQTVSLESPVPVSSGETVWLSWVFENNPGIRYTSGTLGRAESSEGWDSGMPSSFGIAGYANYQYSIYCTYMSGGVSELTAGSDEVYDLITKNSNRRAVPVTVGSSGSISSISIYHEGGSGGLLLGVYSEDNGSPGSLLGVTSSTAIKATSGWQTVSLESPVPVSSGETVWLSWVFENNPGIRYTSGTSGRAESSEGWDSGMPSSFGIAGYANYQYSIYCTYMSGGVSELTAGSDEVYDLITKNSNRRAVPVTVGSSGSISSISIYHEGGSGGLLLGVYSEDNGSPGSLLGVTSSTAIKATSGWQTVSLESPVPVSSGETVWLSWVFENNPGIRYTSGTLGRAESSEGWDSGMPSSFGIAGYANYQYSIYCTYVNLLSKSTTILLNEGSATSYNYSIQYSTEEVTIKEGEFYQSWTEPGTYQRALTASSGADSIVTTILYVVPVDFASEADNIREVVADLNNEGLLSKGDLKIYPNPASCYCNIEYPLIPDLKTKMIILNSLGKIVFNQYVDFISTRVDVSSFPSGMYFVRIINEESVTTKKLIISR